MLRFSHWHVAISLLSLIAACGPGSRATTSPPAAPGAPAASEPEHDTLQWFEDGPAAAFDAARARKRLLFVDLWAPWCHTCLSMRQQVAVWPTFYLIDAQTRAVPGRWLGGASPAQLRRWLQDSANGATSATQSPSK